MLRDAAWGGLPAACLKAQPLREAVSCGSRRGQLFPAADAQLPPHAGQRLPCPDRAPRSAGHPRLRLYGSPAARCWLPSRGAGHDSTPRFRGAGSRRPAEDFQTRSCGNATGNGQSRRRSRSRSQPKQPSVSRAWPNLGPLGCRCRGSSGPRARSVRSPNLRRVVRASSASPAARSDSRSITSLASSVTQAVAVDHVIPWAFIAVRRASMTSSTASPSAWLQAAIAPPPADGWDRRPLAVTPGLPLALLRQGASRPCGPPGLASRGSRRLITDRREMLGTRHHPVTQALRPLGMGALFLVVRMTGAV